MDPWRKEFLGLQVCDIIIWKDEAIEMEGQPAVVSPGMKGKVLSLHDGFHLDVAEVERARHFKDREGGVTPVFTQNLHPILNPGLLAKVLGAF